MSTSSTTVEGIDVVQLKLDARPSDDVICGPDVVWAPGGMLVHQDSFLDDASAARIDALRSEFIDWTAGDGETYRRVCLKEVPGLQHSIERIVGPVDMAAQGYRLNYAGELPNQAIHSDLGWGTHAAVVYLCHGRGGTALWRHKRTGATQVRYGDEALLQEVCTDWDSPDAWDQVAMVNLAFNRGLIYTGRLFHSRWPFEGFGSEPEDGRLVAVAFFTPRSRA